MITLTIIGVVAAMTIPTLLADYQKRQFETANTVFLKRMQDAAKAMDMGNALQGYKDTAEFIPVLKKYLKVAKTCDPSGLKGCFTENVNVEVPVSGGTTQASKIAVSGLNDIKKLRGGNGLPTDDASNSAYGLVLANGYEVLLAYDPVCGTGDVTGTGAQALSCMVMLYDTNGSKGPNKMGRDIHGVNTLLPLNDFTPVAINTCSEDSPYYSKGNSSCGTDLWAGAKKACEDLGLRLLSSPVTSGCSYFRDGEVTNADNCVFGTKYYNPAAVAEGTEPRTIWNWCQNNNTCSPTYWLSEVFVPNPNNSYYMVTNSSTGRVSYTSHNSAYPQGRCVP